MTNTIQQIKDGLEEEIAILNIAPRNIQLLFNIGSKYYALYSVLNEYDYLAKSIKYLTELVQIDSNHFEGLRLLGSAYIQCMNTQEFPIEFEIELNRSIAQVLKDAIKLRPDSLECLGMLAPTLGYLGEVTNDLNLVKECVEISERVLRINPNDHLIKGVLNENKSKIYERSNIIGLNTEYTLFAKKAIEYVNGKATGRELECECKVVLKQIHDNQYSLFIYNIEDFPIEVMRGIKQAIVTKKTNELTVIQGFGLSNNNTSISHLQAKILFKDNEITSVEYIVSDKNASLLYNKDS